MKKLLLCAAMAIGAFGIPGAAMAAAPDAATCPQPEFPDGWEITRKGPLEIPAAWRGMIGATFHNLAVPTLSGRTLCIDVSQVDSIDDIVLSPDGRFLSFGWIGYEIYGHFLVDRRGAGTIHEVGANPVFSASRRMFAAVDLNEIDAGRLTGVGIWRVGPAGVAQVGTIGSIPEMLDWRVDGWSGDRCVNLSAIAGGPNAPDALDWPKARRTRFTARSTRSGWALARSPAGCPKA